MMKENKKIKNYKLIHIILVILMCTVAFLALSIGRYTLSPGDIIRYLLGQKVQNNMIETVLWSVRIPRIIMALVVGSGLSVAGVSLQAMFGNPLVSAHVLGVSHSAGFGAALGILLFSNFFYVQISAILFGFIGMGITYFMSMQKGRSTTLMLVLSGVIVGSVFEALTSLIKYLADPDDKLPTITYWLMGSLAGTSKNDIIKGVPLIGGAILVLWLLRWRLNVISLREEEAISMGINLKQTRIIIIIATTFITAITVSFCGVIAFVGLAVPHFARMIVGNDHKHLLPACIWIGGSYMIIIDTLARSATASEIPLSILTAIVGAPIFGIMLRKTGGAWND